ncbi:beta-hexosaminidase 1 [Cynara cardunculus var. scolymus]|uniref:beta-hexosaminidase 1 n=1 Tax=Cynara cardunculus var. scolymus TaxID=59895 RepID=UPI000D62E975|nr:beta-hexosaminidase 1 [Cynara cardunculus var. scolymus]
MSPKFPIPNLQSPRYFFTLLSILLYLTPIISSRTLPTIASFSHLSHDSSITYLWPLPSEFTSGNETLAVDPDLSLSVSGNGGNSVIITEAFERYRTIIFKHVGSSKFGGIRTLGYDISKLTIVVNSNDEELQLGVDESYTLLVAKNNGLSVIGEVTIEANTVYGALRGLETFSQLCGFDYGTKTVQIYKAPWFIRDKPRFVFRGLLLDTSRHYYPIEIIKQIIESMSYAKLNVLHWHIIDEQSFPLEVPAYPKLWEGAYTKWERYSVEDAYEIVNFAKMRGINVMAEIDIPGHAESWGNGYPDLWPSDSCKEPLDVSKNFTFEVLSGILEDMRQIFPFELFHLGGDEVNTDCWRNTPHVNQWLQEMNMTAKDAYQYFVLRAQEIAISKNWTPVNWEETFNTFAGKLNPRTVVHNWLGPGVCPKVVAQGFKCIYSNQGVWYLDHLDVPWDGFYDAEPLEGITDASQQKLVLGGEVCMWSETADPSNVQQTIWPRAAAAAERLWSSMEAAPRSNTSETALTRLQHFRCLLTRRGVQASPVTNLYARSPPSGPGSCYEQ